MAWVDLKHYTHLFPEKIDRSDILRKGKDKNIMRISRRRYRPHPCRRDRLAWLLLQQMKDHCEQIWINWITDFHLNLTYHKFNRTWRAKIRSSHVYPSIFRNRANANPDHILVWGKVQGIRVVRWCSWFWNRTGILPKFGNRIIKAA